MSITLTLPTVLANLADGNRTLEAEGKTLGEVVDQLSARFPRLGSRLRDEQGQPYAFVTFYLNDCDMRLRGGFGVEVSDGDEVTVVPAIAGG